MRYNLVIENSLNRLTSLQRVRVKADPKFLQKEGTPEKCPSYEGYILEEGLTKVKILVLPPDLSIEEIPTDLIEYIADEDKVNAFDDLKRFALEKLCLGEGNPLIHQIEACNNINELEIFLKQTGMDTNQISNLYGEFITT